MQERGYGVKFWTVLRSCLCSPVNRRNSQIRSTLILNMFLSGDTRQTGECLCLGILTSGKQTKIICHNTSLRPPPSPPPAIPSARAQAAPLSLPSSPARALLQRGAEYCARGHSIGQRRRPSPFPFGAASLSSGRACWRGAARTARWPKHWRRQGCVTCRSALAETNHPSGVS